MAFSICLADPMLRAAKFAHLNEHLVHCVTRKRHVDVVELGAGCGLVGLCFAIVEPSSRVVLTDIDQAQAHLRRNVQTVAAGEWRDSLHPGSRVSVECLDWDDALPSDLAERAFDVIIVSDCTYNTDSTSALVRTISELMPRAGDALAIIAMKKRHLDENIFFDLMLKTGLSLTSTTNIDLPYSRDSTDIRFADEIVDFYIYKRSQRS